MGVGLILLSHGSRLRENTDRFLGLLAERTSFLLPEGIRLVVAHLQFGSPDLPEAVEELVASGYRRIFVLPFFLLPGRHPHEDVPRMLEGICGRHPDVSLTLCSSLGEQPWLFEAVSRWIFDVLPPEVLFPPLSDTTVSGAEIMERSMSFAKSMAREAALPSENGSGLLEVAARVLHATGDPSLAASLRGTSDAVERGLAALVERKSVVVDVEMVKAGTDKRLLGKLGCSLHCAVEEAGAVPPGHTRTSWGMRMLASRLDGALVAVGNAPTALLALIKMIRDGTATPSMVIGVPVGFVQAVEAKRRLLDLGVPCMVVEGTRGGSSAAAAALNCLLDMATCRLTNCMPDCSSHQSSPPR